MLLVMFIRKDSSNFSKLTTFQKIWFLGFLSPAYFHHYNSQVQQSSSHEKQDNFLVKYEDETSKPSFKKPKRNGGEQLILGLGPIQTLVWRLTNIIPLEAVRKHLTMFRKIGNESGDMSSMENHNIQSANDETDAKP
ncbi:hypothetical protein Cni_G06304 [Canna indica]|uniref:Uncharacterized protein n=1 Tax=Canna indica TaxID=4628 RepID=A0AAQ3JX13_9LILI|nr:hypothetical protein Cni_G06304 [Canna indica]